MAEGAHGRRHRRRFAIIWDKDASVGAELRTWYGVVGQPHRSASEPPLVRLTPRDSPKVRSWYMIFSSKFKMEDRAKIILGTAYIDNPHASIRKSIYR